MSISGIQGLPLEVNVVGCYNLDDKEWLSRQDPYVSLEYGGTKYRTKTCTDGGKNPIFQEKYIFTLIEGLRELNVCVWNSRTLSADEHIGTGRIQLQKALSQGYDDASWPLQSKSGRHSGEVRLILHYSNASNQHKAKLATSGPQYATQQGAMSQVLPYDQLPPAPAAYYPATTSYSIPSPYTGYPPNPATYLPSTYLATPPAGYPPQPCPPAGYPQQTYPLPPQASTYYPPAGVYPPPPSSSGIYPPPPY